jgi:alpha-N-arabinofuranosidase
VEYCNYKKGTFYSDIRVKNGHEKPFGVKIWDLGNEVDGAPWELGHKGADEYVKIAIEAAKAMRSVDNTIKFVASGSSYYESTGQWVEWNRKVLEGLGDMIDYISIHRYWDNSPDYYTFMGQSAMDFEEKITVPAAEIAAARAMKNVKNPIAISFDEWGTFGRNFLSVLPIAQCLNSFVRHADVVKMANFTMMTSLLNVDREKGDFKSPLFYIFKLFSNNCRGNSVDTYVQCDTFNTDKYKGIPYLDVTTVYNKETQTVFINVVNRNKENAVTAEIISDAHAFNGKAEASVVTSDSLYAGFTFDKQKEYIPATNAIEASGNAIPYTFPAHSFTQIKVGVKDNHLQK